MNDGARTADVQGQGGRFGLVPDHVAELALRLLRGWTPSPPKLASPVSFRWADRDLSAAVRSVSIGADDRLEIVVEGFDLSHFLAEREALRNKPLEGALEDGSEFVADMAYLDMDRATARYWSLVHPERLAKLWVAPVIRGLQSLDAFGNLAIFFDEPEPDGSKRTCGSNQHHRFVGAHTYYLIKCDDAWFVIVDPRSKGPPSREEVYRDMLGLQFVLGRAFFFDVLYGVNETGDTVGLVGGRHGKDHGEHGKALPPVPLELSREHWASEFFEAISRAYRDRPELRPYIALSYYVDALAGAHVENTYLVLHVALEGFSYWLLGGDERPTPPLVDKAKWKTWLRSHGDEIKDLAAPGEGQRLLDRIGSIPKRAPSSRVVQDAFAALGLTVTDEMAGELDEDGRGLIVHAAIMFKESQADVDSYLRKNALVRTMLIALLARVVGYRGAIVGWEHPPGRGYADPPSTWWAVDDAVRSEARRMHHVDACDRRESGPSD
jgi:hypothetical protein